jgi:Tol biopolymer transport system component
LLVFSAGPTNTELVQRSADGSGARELLLKAPFTVYPTSWSRDVGTLLLTADKPDTGYDLWELRAGAEQPRPLIERKSADRWAKLSPDGAWLAYMSNASGNDEVYLAHYPDMAGQTRVSTSGGSWPVWDPDGRALYYRQGNAVMAVSIETSPALELGTPVQLFTGAYMGVDGDRKFDIAPDGERFLMIERVDPTTSRQLVVVQGWSAELERLSPAR